MALVAKVEIAALLMNAKLAAPIWQVLIKSDAHNQKKNPIDFFFLTETYNKLYESETSTK